MFDLTLEAGTLSLADLRRVVSEPVKLSLHPASIKMVEAGARVIDKIFEEKKVVYGVNTGFGSLAKVKIDDADLERLQKNLVLSHSVGTGDYIAPAIVRLILVLKINALAQGYSGMRLETLEALIALLNNEVYPCIPCKGSVGASGDLAPLAHLCAPLLGEGHVYIDGKVCPATEGLKKAGLQPLHLGPKEGLAFLNGTQVSCAFALYGLFLAEKAFAAAIPAGALTIEAAKASTTPFREEISILRRQPGQIEVAALYRDLFQGSAIVESHHNCGKVQDPYSLRCIPQVMGACLDNMRFAAGVLEREANAVTDNPLVFPETGETLSGGNFHAEPVAFAADMLAIVIAEIGAISERRIALLTDANHSGLPAFLVKNPGINSGFMIVHYTAAALASENKQMSHPASVDSLPTSANMEDHVSMATHGARRLAAMAENTATIVAIELLAATQGIEFHRPLKTSKPLEDVIAKIRVRVKPYDEDRYFAPDIEAIKMLVLAGDIGRFV